MGQARRALVLGGGGEIGVAWEIGLLHGLAEAGLDLTDADIVVGTSAGAAVGAELTTGRTPAEAFARQHETDDPELDVGNPSRRLLRLVAQMMVPGSPERRLARLGRKALAAEPLASPEDRMAVLRGRLGDHDWPDRDLRLTAVEAETGRFTVFDRSGPASLLQAVAASCAVPFVWAPVAVDGHHYIDGGMRSAANADVAEGAGTIVVLAPRPQATRRAMAIPAQLAATGAARTTVVSPDAAAKKAMGTNPYDRARRAPSAEAGRRQASEVADEVRRVWAGSGT
jgi:NTE family protein